MSGDLSPPMATPADGLPGIKRQSSYGQILKSSMLIGGSTAIGLFVGIVRAKLMAMILGPAGFGLMGVYTSIADMARSLAEMGINSSGVRQIAAAVGSGDAQTIARTVAVLRRVAIVLALVGGLLLILLARPISTLTFGSSAHWGAVSLLSVAVFLRLVADGQGALMQGLRQIADMARINVIAALAGTLLSIPIVYAWGAHGVVPAFVAVAAASLIVSWWTVRRIALPAAVPTFTPAQLRQEVSGLLGMGLAFMVSGFMTMGASYIVRMLLVRHQGLESAGLYQAAWTIGGLYVGFVLQAMGADFYPRLVATAKDNSECRRLVNEQAHISLLLSGCGVMGTLTFAPWIVSLLYSADFKAGTDVLRWIVLGMAMRVITWPIGYILVAKGARTLFITTDLIWAIANVAMTWIAVRLFGLSGAGMAFFGAYVVHLVLVCAMTRRIADFRWSPTNLRTGFVYASLVALVFISHEVLDPAMAMAVGSAATIASAAYSFRELRTLAEPAHLPRWLTRVLTVARSAR